MTSTTTSFTSATVSNTSAAIAAQVLGRMRGPTAPARLVPTEAQRRAQEAFDLDAAMDALPPDTPSAVTSYQGRAGVRLRAHLVADISDALLREFASATLGAKRCSEQYLDALRVVLGNQAEAERLGYVLEMNQRVSFAPQRVMRTLIDQMQTAGLTFGVVVQLGEGKCQVVQCFASRPHQHPSPEAALEFMTRRDEAHADARRELDEASGKAIQPSPADAFDRIDSGAVPH